MRAMCVRLAQLLQHVYVGDAGAMSRAMGYGSETTLRQALRNQDTFPDVERFTAFMKSPARGGVVPNLNWLVNGIEQPLLQVRGGRVVRQLSFGTFIDRYPSIVQRMSRRRK